MKFIGVEELLGIAVLNENHHKKRRRERGPHEEGHSRRQWLQCDRQGRADAVRRQEEMEPSWRRFASKKATDAKEGNTHAANHENIRHEKIGSVGMMEKPIADPGPNDAIVKTTAALVCTSDVHTVRGAIGERTNMTLGHEAVGVIYKLGGAVKGFREGDRVAVNAITPCYQCENCLRGYTSQCTEMLGGWKFANVKDGNLAEYFHVNSAQANLATIPPSLTDEQVAYCTDMMSTGFMGAEHANIPLGLSGCLRAGTSRTDGHRGGPVLGAGLVIAVEVVPQRKKLAKEFGADVVLDFKEQDPVRAILDLTGGRGGLVHRGLGGSGDLRGLRQGHASGRDDLEY